MLTHCHMCEYNRPIFIIWVTSKTICPLWKRPIAGSNASGLHTLSQVEDGPGHLQPLVPVRHLQCVQEPHHIRPLLLRRQLDPPPAPSCRTQQHSAQGYFQKSWRVFTGFSFIKRWLCRDKQETWNGEGKVEIELLFSCEAKLKMDVYHLAKMPSQSNKSGELEELQALKEL